MTDQSTESIHLKTYQLLGIDTGGTFTDFVFWTGHSIHTHKLLSTPGAPEKAVLQGIADLQTMVPLDKKSILVIHGTTVATNAALQRKGVETVYITNNGLGDLLTIGRQTRKELYNLTPAPVAPPVPDSHIFEVDGRVDANGHQIEPLNPTQLQNLVAEVDALGPVSIAINLLFSFVDDQYERRIASLFEERYFVSRSSAVLPEYREYERGIATWLNAWLGPVTRDYLLALSHSLAPAPLTIMQSSGRTMHVEQAAKRAVNILLSGPAAGLAGAQHMGGLNNTQRLMTFDMGGTSTDVALIDGEIKLTSDGQISGYPVAVPMTDMHTIGAGGGSIAYLDPGGLLQVGPESSAADPGPACYDRGGVRPTVTDANLVLGRLRPDNFLGGRMKLNIEAARRAIRNLAQLLDMGIEETADGIIKVANEKMVQALRVISVQRGYDPRQFQLACFGGAGGLHYCALAEALDIHQALIPVYAGVLSAFGMLVAKPGRELSRTHLCEMQPALKPEITARFEELVQQGQKELELEGVSASALQVKHSLDLRYRGQTHTLSIPWTDIRAAIRNFHLLHQHRYGHALSQPVELVNLRVSISALSHPVALPEIGFEGIRGEPEILNLPGFESPIGLFERSQLGAGSVIRGPSLITETMATTLIHPGWSGQVDRVGNILVNREN